MNANLPNIGKFNPFLKMNITAVTESQELSQFSGVIKIDTSKGAVTIFMKPSPNESQLKLVKVSKDNNIVALFSDESLIDGAEITVFGFSKKLKNLVLKSNGKNWNMVKN